MFDSRVDKVLVDLGPVIKEGDPCPALQQTWPRPRAPHERPFSQWTRDKKVLATEAAREQGSLPRTRTLIEVRGTTRRSAGWG